MTNGDTEKPPIPDPTVLTTEQLLREIRNSEKLTDAKIDGIELVRDEKFRATKANCDEQFKSVGVQLSLVERQRVEQKADTKAAVDAALAAAKEAVKEQTTASGLSIAKSETATSEQLKQLTVTFTTAISGVTSTINDLKDRVVTIESVRQGGKDTVSGIYAFAAFLVAVLIIGGFAAALGMK